MHADGEWWVAELATAVHQIYFIVLCCLNRVWLLFAYSPNIVSRQSETMLELTWHDKTAKTFTILCGTEHSRSHYRNTSQTTHAHSIEKQHCLCSLLGPFFMNFEHTSDFTHSQLNSWRVVHTLFFVIEEKTHRSPFAIIIAPSNRLCSICYNVFIAMICEIIKVVVVQPSLNNFIGLGLPTAIEALVNWESLHLLHQQDGIEKMQSIPELI